MMIKLEKVEEFHKVFDLPVLDKPEIPEDRKELRISLIQEESNELAEAIRRGDKAHVLKEASDLLYVLYGAMLEFGMGGVFDQAFHKVHASNMTKLCYGADELRKSIQYYQETKGVESKGELVDWAIEDGFYILRRIPDGKVLKSINYHSAEPLIEKLLQDPN